MKAWIEEAEAWEQEEIERGTSNLFQITNRFVNTPFNQRLLSQNEYLNPLILDKVVDYYSLDEIGTNYPQSVYNPHSHAPDDFFEEIAHRQTQLLQQQQDELIRKRKQQEANREKMVESRVQRIAEITNTDVKVVEETLAKQRQLGGRFDSVFQR